MSRHLLRRMAFWILLAGFISGSLIWMLKVPVRRERLWRTVPANSTWVIVQHDLAGNWGRMSDNPLVRALVGGMGFETDVLDLTSKNPAFQDGLHRLASDTLLLFCFPSSSRKPDTVTWAAVTWIGGQSQHLRWMLKGTSFSEFHRTGDYQGRGIWVWKSPEMPPGQALYLAFEEGILIACLSSHPSDLIRLLATYDGQAPAFDPAHYELEVSKKIPIAGVALNTGAWGPVTFKFSEIGPKQLSGQIQLLEGPALLCPAVLSPPSFLTDRAEAILITPVNLVGKWVLPYWHPDWLTELWRNMEPLCKQPIALGLFGGDLSGRLMGLRIPALLAATPVENELQAVKDLLMTLDSMNARFQLGLIAGKETVGRYALYVLEGTTGGWYANLAPEERAGFAVGEGWFVASSHAGTLRTLLASHSTPSPSAPGGEPETNSILHGWLRLGAGGKTIRGALAVLSLRAVLNGDSPTGGRTRLRILRDWILSLEPLDQIEVRVTQLDNRLNIDFTSRVIPLEFKSVP